MSDKQMFSQDELKEFEVVNDWVGFAKVNILKSVGRIGSIFIEKKIFDLDTDIPFKAEYAGEVVFNKCIFTQGICFYDAIFHKKFTLINCFVKGTIGNLGNPTFHAGLFILKSQVDTISLTKGDFGSSNWSISRSHRLTISGGIFSNLDITLEGVVNILKIEASKIKGDIFVDGCGQLVEAVNISGTARDLSLFIHDIKISQLVIGLFVNEKRFKLSNIKPYSEKGNVLVSNSQLGKAEISSVDFSEFNAVVFDEVNLVDCAFNNVMWSKNVFGSALPNESDGRNGNRIFSLKSRETFRQLKYAMSKQGDVINEQKFHSLEMGMYFETLSWLRNFSTKSIIFLSHLTSNFGQSLGRPLIFIFSGHTILFSILLFNDVFKGFQFSLSVFSSTAFWEGFNSYFYLINPIRPFDKEMFHGGWVAIDLLMRVSSSYMIYNIIRATRRFIK
ncbi:hypothetical protein [Chitinophaga lutea]|nr:hypothetical protein [Chitinophaga lutea]